MLEYYEGIMILTSNRVGIFDEAFRSRIQVALHYPDLKPYSRYKIWQNFFRMLEDDQVDADLLDLNQHLDELAEEKMNGREIRNVLTTARQLALFKEETLCWKHLEQTLTIGRDFTKYLEDVHGHRDEDRAREENLR